MLVTAVHSHGLLSQLAGVAEGSHCEKHEQDGHGHCHANEPARHVARPGAKRGVEPGQRENGKHRADKFVKKLAQDAPQASEPLGL